MKKQGRKLRVEGHGERGKPLDYHRKSQVMSYVSKWDKGRMLAFLK